MRRVIPPSHVYKGRVEARLNYPASDPPDRIEIRGTTWTLERTAKRRWNPRYAMWVCPHCDGADMSGNEFCPTCGIRFVGNGPSE